MAFRPSVRPSVSPLSPSSLTLASPADILSRLSTLFPSAAPSITRPHQAVAQAPARHLAKYIFPRQFGLHNVFTSEKARTSLEIMPDYLDREVEIKVRRSDPLLALAHVERRPTTLASCRSWARSRRRSASSRSCRSSTSSRS